MADAGPQAQQAPSHCCHQTRAWHGEVGRPVPWVQQTAAAGPHQDSAARCQPYLASPDGLCAHVAFNAERPVRQRLGLGAVRSRNSGPMCLGRWRQRPSTAEKVQEPCLQSNATRYHLPVTGGVLDVQEGGSATKP